MARRSRFCQTLLVVLAGIGAFDVPVQARENSPSRDGATDVEARLELGRLYHEQVFQSLDRAIAEYEAAVKARPDLPEARYYLGLAYHTKGKLQADDAGLYRQALGEYRQYLTLAPRGDLAPIARRNIAAIQARLGQSGTRASPVPPAARGRARAGRAP